HCPRAGGICRYGAERELVMRPVRAWSRRTAPAVLTACLVLATACGDASSQAASHPGRPTPPPAAPAANAGAARGAPSGNHVGPAEAYPDPQLTPGDVFPGVTAQEVCVAGYAKSVRAVTQDEKNAVYRRYGVTRQPGDHEVDHFI